MRTISIKLMAAAVAVAVSSPALAADAIEAPPSPPISDTTFSPEPVATWSGFYAGVSAGYGWGTFDSTVGDLEANGINGTGFVGYNLQSGPLVYGVEGDVGLSGAKANVGGVEVEQGVFGSLRARLGYSFDPFMLYGTGGVAATRATVTDGAASDTNTHIGWTAGVGGEALLTEQIFGRVEYRYSDYQSKDFVAGGTAVSSGFSDHSVRAGVGVKF